MPYTSCSSSYTAVVADGKLYTWGRGASVLEEHLAGHGSDVIELDRPRAVEGELLGKRVVAVSAGVFHTLALTDDGKVHCFGFGGAYRWNSPPGLRCVQGRRYTAAVRAVSAGLESSAVVTEDGEVFMWGKLYGPDRGSHSCQTLIEGGGIKGVVSVSIGDKHVAAVTSDGLLFTWGVGTHGRLGNNSTRGRTFPGRVKGELSDKRVVACAARSANTVAVTDEGEVYEFGDGCKSPKLVEGELSGKKIVAVSAFGDVTAVLTRDGKVYTWESSPDHPFFQRPALVEGDLRRKKVVGISVGTIHATAVTCDGELYVWPIWPLAPDMSEFPHKCMFGLGPIALAPSTPTLVPTPPGVTRWGVASVAATDAEESPASDMLEEVVVEVRDVETDLSVLEDEDLQTTFAKLTRAGDKLDDLINRALPLRDEVTEKQNKLKGEMSIRRCAEVLELNKNYVCPISQSMMRVPVVAADGHSYEKKAIEQWLAGGKTTSPLTGKKLTHTLLTPNHNLRSEIQDALDVTMAAETAATDAAGGSGSGGGGGDGGGDGAVNPSSSKRRRVVASGVATADETVHTTAARGAGGSGSGGGGGERAGGMTAEVLGRLRRFGRHINYSESDWWKSRGL